MDYQYYNIGSCNKQAGCVKRALSAVSGLDLSDLNDLINANMVDHSKPYNSRINYEHIISMLGGRLIKASAINKMWHVNSIEKILPDHLSFIIYIYNHVFAVNNNIIYDIKDDRIGNRAIQRLYVFNATDEEFEDIKQKFLGGEY